MSLFKSFIEKYKCRKDSVKFWRSKGAIIGDDCEIYSSANLGSEPYLVKIGNHVRINSGVSFVTHDGGVWVLRELKDEYQDIDLFGKIEIGNNVHIGTNSIIMPSVKIGNNCIIGCGAIVTKDIPDNSIAVGIPAKVIESIDEYKEKHANDFLHTKKISYEEKKNILIKQFNFNAN